MQGRLDSIMFWKFGSNDGFEYEISSMFSESELLFWTIISITLSTSLSNVSNEVWTWFLNSSSTIGGLTSSNAAVIVRTLEPGIVIEPEEGSILRTDLGDNHFPIFSLSSLINTSTRSQKAIGGFEQVLERRIRVSFLLLKEHHKQISYLDWLD